MLQEFDINSIVFSQGCMYDRDETDQSLLHPTNSLSGTTNVLSTLKPCSLLPLRPEPHILAAGAEANGLVAADEIVGSSRQRKVRT